MGLVWLAVAVTFGVRRPGGAFLAGLAYSCTGLIFLWIGNDFLTGGFHDLTTAVYFTPILFGLGAINLAKNPDGLLSLIGQQRVEKRRKREHAAAIAAAEAEVHGGTIPEHELVHADTVTGEPASVEAAPADGGALAVATPGDVEAAPAVAANGEAALAVAANGGAAPAGVDVHRRVRRPDVPAPDVPAVPGVPAVSGATEMPATPDVPDVAAPVVDGTPAPALSLRGIFAGYGDVEVLHGVDVDVQESTVVALLGANGAGKSTLCGVAAGLLTPTQRSGAHRRPRRDRGARVPPGARRRPARTGSPGYLPRPLGRGEPPRAAAQPE